MVFYVYILKCFRNKEFCNFYTGYTNDMNRRLAQHQKNAETQNRKKYTGRFDKISLGCYELFKIKENAKKREKKIKLMSTKSKQLLIENFKKLHSKA